MLFYHWLIFRCYCNMPTAYYKNQPSMRSKWNGSWLYKDASLCKFLITSSDSSTDNIACLFCLTLFVQNIISSFARIMLVIDIIKKIFAYPIMCQTCVFWFIKRMWSAISQNLHDSCGMRRNQSLSLILIYMEPRAISFFA